MSSGCEATFLLPLGFEKLEVIGEAYIAGMSTARQFLGISSFVHLQSTKSNPLEMGVIPSLNLAHRLYLLLGSMQTVIHSVPRKDFILVIRRQ